MSADKSGKALACRTCAAPTPAEARFCPGCGAKLPSPPDTGTSGSEGRVWRPLAVLFAGLTTSASGRTMRADDWHHLATALLRSAEETAQRHGGTIDRFSLAQVKLVFSPRAARSEHAGSAGRAAADLAARLRNGLDELHHQRGLQASFHIALHAADALVNPIGNEQTPEGHGLVAGVAARVLQQTPSGAIWLTEQAARLCGEELHSRPLGAFEIRGLPERLVLHELMTIDSPDIVVSRRAKDAPALEGREAELAWLERAVERVEQQGNAVRVVIEGAAGIGKTRLVTDFADRLERRGFRTFLARGTPQLRFEPLSGVRRFLREQLGRTMPGHGASANLISREHLATRLADLAVEFALDLQALRGLLEPDGVGAPLPAVTPERQAAALEGLMRAFLGSSPTTTPRAFIADDAQYIDPTSSALCASAMASTDPAPLLMIMTIRSGEGLPWMAPEFGFERLVLSPLGASECRNLVKRVVQDHPNASDTVVASIARRSGGNPLFAEELARAALDTERAAGQPLPTSLRAAVASRLDHLQAPLPRLVRIAGVIGPAFPVGLLARLLELEPSLLEPLLAELEREGVIRPALTDEPGDRAFCHPVLAEVAAAEMPAAERAALEARIAGILAVADGTETSVNPAHIATRLAAAGDFAAALRWYARAVKLAANDPSAALEHLRSLLALARARPTEPYSAKEGLAASLELLRLSWTYGVGEAEVEATAMDGRDWARALHDPEAEALLLDLHASLLSSLGRIPPALAVAEEGRTIAAQRGHPDLITALGARRAFVLYYAGNLRAVRDATATCAPEGTSPDLGRSFLGFSPALYLGMLSGVCAMEFGRFEEARTLLRQAALASAAAGDLVVSAWVVACAGPLAHASGIEVDHAIEQSELALTQLQGMAAPLAVAAAGLSLGIALLAGRRFDDAHEVLGHALATTRSRSQAWLVEAPICAALSRALTGSSRADKALEPARYAVTFTRLRSARLLELDALAALAEALIAQGDTTALSEAELRLDEMAPLIEKTGAERFRAWRHRSLSLLAARRGDKQRAREDATLAAEIFAHHGAEPLAAEMRRRARA